MSGSFGLPLKGSSERQICFVHILVSTALKTYLAPNRSVFHRWMVLSAPVFKSSCLVLVTFGVFCRT